jgi:hypothetical protein
MVIHELVLYYYPGSRHVSIQHTSTPRGAYSPCCRKQRKGLFSNIAISSCQVLSYGWVNQFPNDDISVVGLEPAMLRLWAKHLTSELAMPSWCFGINYLAHLTHYLAHTSRKYYSHISMQLVLVSSTPKIPTSPSITIAFGILCKNYHI